MFDCFGLCVLRTKFALQASGEFCVFNFLLRKNCRAYPHKVEDSLEEDSVIFNAVSYA